MSPSIALEPTLNDPLLTKTPLTYETVRYPYGFPARIRSNSPITMTAAEISWGTYRRKFDCPPIDVRLFVAESDSPALVKAPKFRSQGHLMSIVGDNENFACLDLKAGLSFGWVTTATAEKTEYFRQCFLDVMIYPLLEIQHMVTLHSACVVFEGTGVLLAGDSGAGKSSLAYACARRGWTYVSDDASAFVRSASRPMVIGHPQKFRFREPVAELFPEFTGLKSTVRAYGKPTIEVRTSNIDWIRTADEGPIDYIVFLNRAQHSGGAPLLRRMREEAVWRRLSFSAWAVQLPAYEERLAAIERLLRVPTYELYYSEFDPAIDLLQRLAGGEAF